MKTWGCFRLSILLIALLAPATQGRAQSYSIDWFTIDGGGGTSSGGPYQISGTIGQPDAAVVSGGNYAIAGGYWGLITTLQTAGAPTLFISRSGNTVTIYWQDVAGWALQQSGNLNDSNGWTGSGGVTTKDGTNSLSVAAPAGNLFFRLQQP